MEYSTILVHEITLSHIDSGQQDGSWTAVTVNGIRFERGALPIPDHYVVGQRVRFKADKAEGRIVHYQDRYMVIQMDKIEMREGHSTQLRALCSMNVQISPHDPIEALA